MGLWAVILGVLVGVVIGGIGGFLLFRSWRRGQTSRTLVAQTLPDGVVQSLAALPFPAFVVNASNEVLLTTPTLDALRLVDGRRVLLPEITADIDEARSTASPLTERLVLHRGRGERADRHVTVHVSVLGNRYILVVVEDRTRAVLAETMRRDFTANVSHELKTPISAVLLLAEAIHDSADDPEAVRHFADRLGEEADRLRRMVGGILALSRIESELDEPETFAPVDLRGIVDGAVSATGVAAEGRNISVTVRTQGDLVVRGDADALESAVTNLLSNAIEHSPHGADVGVQATGDADGVTVIVSDQGEGIPKAKQERVFERFYRVDPARSRESGTGGTGLGLSIVKHVALRHGGSVSLWSKVGVGSSFTLRLPREQAADVLASEPDADRSRAVVVR
jgi:two-component system sensor histidine kinase SenX3